VASITLEAGMSETMIVEGATDAEVFEAYIEHFLAPTLEEEQVVVLDRLWAHRGERVRELIEARGTELLFLPSYSPDYNPMEEAVSKIKGMVCKLDARTREALVKAIELALATVTPEDAAGWFAHAGYRSQDQSL
jgi:transposase